VPSSRAKLVTSVIAIAAIASALSGCAGAHRRAMRDFPQWERALVLSTTIPPSVQADTAVSASFRLRNEGDRTIDACVGPGRNAVTFSEVAIQGRSPVAAIVDIVDHPGCSQRFSVRPGATFEWMEEVHVPDAVPGAARLILGVQIVHPRACSRKYGCYATELRTTVPVSVRTGSVDGSP
jgi:hypothetical protein